MNKLVELSISAVIVISLTLLLSRSLKLSAKYERKPRKLSDWNSLDQGIDPTEDSESKR
ncbi:hypothetical protein GM50_5365 [freshwater metagenome]|uniref:Uncharacterized protein n=1 Tax=freshwater metagenome TaxID=449393 RepID=A0A094QY15_9ZZZZ